MPIKNNCFAVGKELKTQRAWNKHRGLNLIPNLLDWSTRWEKGEKTPPVVWKWLSCSHGICGMDGVPLTIERLIQVQVERFGVTQTSATIISTSHWLWFQVYYSTPKPHAILLSLLFSPDQNKQVSAHLCITTVRYRNIPTHSTRSSKTVLTVKRSVFTNISFLCLSPLDFSIIGKIFRVSRSPLLLKWNTITYCRVSQRWVPREPFHFLYNKPTVLNDHFPTSADICNLLAFQ